MVQTNWKCPYSNGPAVFRARAIYELGDPEAIYNDEDVCLLQGMYRDQALFRSEQSDVFIKKVNECHRADILTEWE